MNINPNLAPPANFWEGDKFRIGAPGLQSVQPGQQMPQMPTAQAQPQPAQQAPAGGFDPFYYMQNNPGVVSYFENNQKALDKFGGDMSSAVKYHYDTFGKNEGRAGYAGANPSPAPAAPATPAPAAQGAGNPFLNPGQLGLQGNSLQSLFKSGNPLMQAYGSLR